MSAHRAPTFSRQYGDEQKRQEDFIPETNPEAEIRDWRIHRRDVLEHGPTEGCPGCRHIVSGNTGHRPHTKECRKRLREKIVDTEEGRDRVARAGERAMSAAGQPAATQQGGESAASAANRSSFPPVVLPGTSRDGREHTFQDVRNFSTTSQAIDVDEELPGEPLVDDGRDPSTAAPARPPTAAARPPTAAPAPAPAVGVPLRAGFHGPRDA